MGKSEVLISVNRHISLRKAEFLQTFTILNSDSDKDVNNGKDGMFETITAEEQVMILPMMKDSFLLQGFWQLKDNYEMIEINSLSKIKKIGDKPFKVVVDIYHSHILDEEAIRFLEKLGVERIIVLAPYHISKLKVKVPIYFASRKESTKDLLKITYGKYLPRKNSQLRFSHNQLKIIQLILKNKSEGNIMSTPNTSQRILKVQKFSAMYKLKLRRMSDIVALGITSYFQ